MANYIAWKNILYLCNIFLFFYWFNWWW